MKINNFCLGGTGELDKIGFFARLAQLDRASDF